MTPSIRITFYSAAGIPVQWARVSGRWVCPHDPTGIDRDTAAYCPDARWLPHDS